MILLVLTTFPSSDKAAEVARTLVEEHLAACVNIVPAVRSIYRWDGAICDESEVLAIVKTTPERRDSLAARLAALHPYTTPEIVMLDADASATYAAWVTSETA